LHVVVAVLQALLRAIHEGGFPTGPALILAFDLLAEALQLQQARGPAATQEAAALLCGAPALQRLLGHAGAMLGVLAVDEQLRRLLGCLVRLAGLCKGQFHAAAGGVVPQQLLDALAKQLAAKDAVLEDAGTFLEVCRSYAKLRHVPGALLEEAVLRRLLRVPGVTGAGDAGATGDDSGFGVLLAALQRLANAGLALDGKQQEAVEKVRGKGHGTCRVKMDTGGLTASASAVCCCIPAALPPPVSSSAVQLIRDMDVPYRASLCQITQFPVTIAAMICMPCLLLLQVLLDQLSKRPTRQVAALVGRYHQLGLAASRVMKKAAAEFARRPEEEADPHMLLEVLQGLAGFGDVKVLPPQLLTRWV
jgi:hypothetical protein